MSAGRYIELHIDAHRLEVGRHFLRTQVLLTAAAPEALLPLLVEPVGILEHTVKACLNINAEERATECAEVCELVEMRENDIECLESSPRQSCHGTVLATGLAAECLLYHGDKVFQNDGIE